jgi:carboxyl-terminal processing protease
MPSGRAAALLVLATSALAVCGHPTEPDGALRPGAPRGVSNLDVPRDAFRAEFEAILATIDQSYGLKGAKGIDVGELRGRFGPDIDRAASPEAFYAVLVRLFAALHNSHSSLVLPASAFGFAGMTASLVGDRLLVAGAPADAALVDHGVARGWEVTAIDDVALADWMAGRSELVSASTTQYGRVAAAAQATRRFWFEPAARRYTLRSPSGDAATLEIRLDRPPAAAAAPPLASSRAIGEIGYVSVDALTGGVVAQFEAELSKVIDKPALILDLRRNTGGDSILALPIIAHLIQQPTRVEWPSQLLQPASNLHYDGPVAVLVGPVTHSAAESLAHNLKDSGRATFIGSATAGSTGNGPQSYETPMGVVFRLATRPNIERSVSGAPTEGAGLAPDIVKEQTYQDFLAGRDTVLDFAVAFLGAR